MIILLYELRDQYISVLCEVLRDLLRDVQDATQYLKLLNT